MDGSSWPRRMRPCATIGLAAVLLSVGLQSYVARVYAVAEESMLPALPPGTRVLVDRLSLGLLGLHRGDIVVFDPPFGACNRPNDGAFIKRVIGVPGQTVAVSVDGVVVDGRRLAESYASDDPLGQTVGRWSLAPDEYFVMGDNRAQSCDSRSFGPVAGAAIVGRVVLPW